MSVWEELPVPVTASIFSLWLDIEDVAVLDSACCRASTREKLYDVYRAMSLPDKVSIKDRAECAWYNRREIQCNSVTIRISANYFAEIRLFLQNCCTQTTDLDLSSSGAPLHIYSLTALVPAINTCTRLTRLCLSYLRVRDEDLLQLTEGRGQIETLHVGHCTWLGPAGFKNVCQQFTNLCTLGLSVPELGDDTILPIIRNNPLLRDLRLISCGATSAGFCSLLDANHNLGKLTYERIDDQGVRKIAECCAQLQFLNIEMSDEVQEGSWVAAFQACKQLRDLRLHYCDTLSGASLNCLSNLEHLSITGNEGITDAGVVALSQRSPHLGVLMLQLCYGLTPDALEPVLRACPELCCIAMSNAEVTSSAMSRLLARYIKKQYPNLLTIDVFLTDDDD